MLILLDSSASVEQEFDKEKDILITLLADGNILKHDIMISVFQYNEVVTQVTSRFENLVDSLTTGLSVKIKDLHNSAGSTNTLEALKAAYWEFKNFGRPDANRILLLITDGRSQNPLESLSEAAGALLKLKVEIFAATASHNPDLSELLLYTQDRNRLFQADDSAAVVPAISSAISRGKCPESDDPRNITVFPTAQLINTTVHSTTTEGYLYRNIATFLNLSEKL